MVRFLAANLWINPKRGGSNSMKKYTLIAVVLALSLFNLVGALTDQASANNGGKLSCDKLAGCGSFASCPGRGSATGCNIVCEDGSFIGCPMG
jgi:hypothetical protein